VYVLLMQKVPQAKGLTTVSPVRAAIKIAPGQRGFNDTSLGGNSYFGAAVAGFEVSECKTPPNILTDVHQMQMSIGICHCP
jgi:hypothetical protein